MITVRINEGKRNSVCCLELLGGKAVSKCEKKYTSVSQYPRWVPPTSVDTRDLWILKTPFYKARKMKGYIKNCSVGAVKMLQSSRLQSCLQSLPGCSIAPSFPQYRPRTQLLLVESAAAQSL